MLYPKDDANGLKGLQTASKPPNWHFCRAQGLTRVQTHIHFPRIWKGNVETEMVQRYTASVPTGGSSKDPHFACDEPFSPDASNTLRKEQWELLLFFSLYIKISSTKWRKSHMVYSTGFHSNCTYLPPRLKLMKILNMYQRPKVVKLGYGLGSSCSHPK